MMEMVWISGVVAFLVAAVCGKLLIPLLHRLKFGQEIRDEGPKWHEKKSGTPTMGGFIFLIGILVSLVVTAALAYGMGWTFPWGKEIGILLGMTLAYGLIGFLDDYIKVILKRNLGLTASQKFGLQLLIAVVFVAWAIFSGSIQPLVKIPFTNLVWDFGWVFIPFAVLVIVGTVNSVNLTDGLDGLAGSVTLAVALFFLLFSGFGNDKNPAITLFAAALLGGLLGFLLYNWHPAKVFMGDTGSLALGGAVCGMALLMEQPLVLLIVGFVYVMEALSVILQVASFKLTGKRIFKMSPIHHHFEMCGWSEKKIVLTFTGVTAVLCALAYFFGA